MDARHEPRFSIYGPVKVTVLSSPERVLDCALTEISATGLKIIAPESLAADEIIAVEAEDHLALADVRYSQPRGDKFTVGCERIHVLNKVSLPEEKSKVEQIRLLVEDYRHRISGGIATARPDADEAVAARLEREISERCGTSEKAAQAAAAAGPELPPEPGPLATREQLLEAAGAWVVEHWDKIQGPAAGAAGRSEIVDRLTLHLAEKLRPPTPKPEPVPENAPQKITQKAPPKTPKKTDIRRWRIPAGLAAAAILGWGLSAVFWSLGSSGTASHIESSIARLIAPKKPPEPSPASSVRHATLKVVEPTWVMASSDGKRLFNKKLVKDDIREIEFSGKALLRVGNAKGLEIILDGKPIGPIGGRGQARLVELSGNGFRLLPLY